MKEILALVAAASVIAVAPAQAQEAGTFTPTGAWVADYGDDYCRLARTFSDGANEVSLALERVQPGGMMRMLLVGNGIRTFRGASEIGYSFQPAGASQKSTYVRSETADRQQFLGFDAITFTPAAFGPGAPPPEPYNRDKEQETAGGLNGIALSEGLTTPVRFETGSLKAPVAALQACADDLLAFWGLDAEKHKTLSVPPIMNPVPNGVLPQGTIPFSEFGKFTGGANQVRLIIGADGKPSSCAIYSPTLSQSLNDRICTLAKERASFQPAKDAAGQAIASYWMGPAMFLGPPFPGMGR